MIAGDQDGDAAEAVAAISLELRLLLGGGARKALVVGVAVSVPRAGGATVTRAPPENCADMLASEADSALMAHITFESNLNGHVKFNLTGAKAPQVTKYPVDLIDPIDLSPT